MGEKNKLLLNLGGRPVLTRVLEAFSEASIPDIIVVTGAERARVMSVTAEGDSIRFVHNPAYPSGMASSIRCGVRAARLQTEGYAICPGDLPLLTAETVCQLGEVFVAQRGPRVVLPTNNGRDGHPVLFGRSFRAALLKLRGDRGARDVLRRHERVITRVAVDDEGIFLDVDTPDALEKLRQRVQ